MNLIEKLKLHFSERVLFVTISALTRITNRRQGSLHDWAFRYGILGAICSYMPKRVFVISNEDAISPFDEREIVSKYEAVVSVLRAATKAKVDYMFCKSDNADNPLKMPNTGMVDYFSHQHFGEEFDRTEILFVGENNVEKECAENIGCTFMYHWEFSAEYEQKRNV